MMHHSSEEFLQNLAKGPININPQYYTKITTTTVEGKLNRITQYTSPVIFKKINTTSSTASTIKNISTPSIQVSTKNQNLVPVSLIFEISSSNKSKINYEKPTPTKITTSNRTTIPNSTDEIFKTPNTRIIKKKW